MNNKEKNTYVKQQITMTLLRLLEKKSLSEITIKELTNEAQIGRVSFYRNFESKEDVLRKESKRLLSEWGSLFENVSGKEYNIHFLSLFDFFKSHQIFYTTIYKAGMSEIIVETLIENAEIKSEMENLEAYLKTFWAYGVYGWILAWIERGMPESAQELVELFQMANQNVNNSNQ